MSTVDHHVRDDSDDDLIVDMPHPRQSLSDLMHETHESSSFPPTCSLGVVAVVVAVVKWKPSIFGHQRNSLHHHATTGKTLLDGDTRAVVADDGSDEKDVGGNGLDVEAGALGVAVAAAGRQRVHVRMRPLFVFWCSCPLSGEDKILSIPTISAERSSANPQP